MLRAGQAPERNGDRCRFIRWAPLVVRVGKRLCRGHGNEDPFGEFLVVVLLGYIAWSGAGRVVLRRDSVQVRLLHLDGDFEEEGIESGLGLADRLGRFQGPAHLLGMRDTRERRQPVGRWLWLGG